MTSCEKYILEYSAERDTFRSCDLLSAAEESGFPKTSVNWFLHKLTYSIFDGNHCSFLGGSGRSIEDRSSVLQASHLKRVGRAYFMRISALDHVSQKAISARLPKFATYQCVIVESLTTNDA